MKLFFGSIFLIILLQLIACNNSRNTNVKDNEVIKHVEFPYLIDIEKNLESPMSVPLSSIGGELEYIPLETKKNSLIGEIQQIEFSSDFIFVGASPKLLQFDRKGKFIRQVGANGRGPGEYNGLNAFCLDKENEKVYILSRWPHRLLEFNFSGKYIRSSNVPWESIQFLVYDTIGLVFHIEDDSNLTLHSRYNVYITDFKSNILYKVKRHFIRESNILIGRTPLYYFNDILHFKQYAVDTLYTLKNEQTEPYAVFNLGKEKMDPNLMFTSSSIDDIKKQIENKIEIREVLENINYLFTKLGFGLSDSSKFCIFNKQTSEITILENNGFINDLDGGISFWPKFVYNNDSMLIDYCGSNELLKNMRNKNLKELREKFGHKYDRLEKMINEVDEMSNPVLIILH